MQQKNDHYQVLGVPKTADKDAIKKAYRALAKKHHPDVSKGDGAEFKKITEAYEVLSDDGRRARYDAMSNGIPSFDIPYGNIFGAFHNSMFTNRNNDVFVSFGGFGGNGKRFSRNQRATVQVRMDEAYIGARVSFDSQRMVECKACSGLGMKPSAGAACQYCGGHGKVMGGLASCSSCRGTGKKGVICSDCGGSGGKDEVAKISFDLPRGTIGGTSVVIKGEGNLSVDGTRGDFLVVVTYEPSLEDVDLMQDGRMRKQVRVPWDLALLGEEVSFKVFRSCPSEERLRLDSSHPNGWVYSIKGKGMLRGRDLLVKVWYDLPTNINEESKKAIARAIRNAKPSGTARQDSDEPGHI